MASSCSLPTNSWLFDLDLVDESSHHLLWATSVSNEESLHHSPLSLEHETSQGDSLCPEKSCSRISESDQEKDYSRKRSRAGSANRVGNKACREKVRRDRLNDRFMELSALLEPCKTPKTDKGSILRDATRILGQMRVEMQQLKDANNRLQETIKELKAEKNELRDEKGSLKLEKERLENHLKTMNVLPSYVSHLHSIHPTSHASLNPLPTMIPSSTQSHLPSKSPFQESPFSSTMTQWIPSSIVDISNDHILRPPVA